MSVAIIDSGSGNLPSAHKAFVRAAAEEGLDAGIVVTSDPERVLAADRLVLPGVGAFADCMDGLSATPGMVEALKGAVAKGTPLLGICVGMQILATRGLEHRVARGLDLVPGDVCRLAPSDPTLKIPHMGWNVLLPERAHPVLEGIDLGPKDCTPTSCIPTRSRLSITRTASPAPTTAEPSRPWSHAIMSWGRSSTPRRASSSVLP